MSDWALRLVHEGHSGVVLERPGRRIRFDPCTELAHDDIAVLTGIDPFAPERTVGFPSVVKANGSGEVYTEVDGVQFEGIPYSPPTPDRHRTRIMAAIKQPGGAVRRWVAKRRPGVATVWHLTFPNGDRLLHLGLALHSEMDVGWAANLVTRFGGARWLIVGAPYGQDDAIASRIPAFGAQHVMVADVEGDLRREAGRPTSLVTPLVDRLESSGVPVMVFVPQSSIRFE